MVESRRRKEPRPLRFAIEAAGAAGLTAILCCVAPAVLFLFGLVGAVSAISFADAFYRADGSAGPGAWALRALALLIAAAATAIFWRREKHCSIDRKQRRKNMLLVGTTIPLLALAVYLGLERATAAYFDRVIVPAQQRELRADGAR